jgi:adenylyltransferase/sulfurtransferase
MELLMTTKLYYNSLNPLTKYNIHKTHLMPANASSIVSSYDLVLDCTDTPASRYLISDTCVLLQKPLVSASALRTEGQLMLLNHPARPPADVTGGPCYRCIFPVPPPAASVLSCGEGGILGPVVGVMGVLQALEAIKMIASGECAIAKHPEPTMRTVTRAPSMLLFSAYQDGQFRSIRMRRRNPKCAVCSAAATVSLQSLDSGSMDYVQFCGSSAPAQLLSPEDRITAVAYADILQTHQPHIVLDVREKVQFDLCHLEGSLNLPFSETVCSGYETQEQINSFVTKVQGLTITDPIAPLYVVCRLGNDSQVVVKRLKELGFDDNGQRWVGDIKGGLRAWTNEVDQDFPDY